MLRQKLICAGVLAGLLCVAVGAHAQVTLTFSPNTQVGAPGSMVTFTGTIANNTGATVFLNGDTVNLTGNGLTFDDTKFFNNAPLSLTAGASTGPIQLFDVLIDPTTSLGSYPGSFTVQGGADSAATDALVTTNFTVNVATSSPTAQTPEPGTLGLLLGIALPASLLSLRRRHRR